jgi:hypothetical protein
VSFPIYPIFCLESFNFGLPENRAQRKHSSTSGRLLFGQIHVNFEVISSDFFDDLLKKSLNIHVAA